MKSIRMFWKSCRAALPVVLLGALPALSACSRTDGGEGAAAPPAEGVVATVNGEPITVHEMERMVRSMGDHKTGGVAAIEKLVENALLRQEARRLGLEESEEFRRRLRRWRQEMAARLFGVEKLRLVVEEREGRPLPFDDFFPRWQEAYRALEAEEQEKIAGEVDTGIALLKSEVPVTFDEKALREYSTMLKISEEARQVEVATVPWGGITVAEVLANEPRFEAHFGQSPEDVHKMWRQVATELAGLEHLLRTIEASGRFDVPGVREEEGLTRGRILKVLFLDQLFASAITEDGVRAGVEKNLTAWTQAYGMEAETIFLAGVRRMEVDKILRAWKEAGNLSTLTPYVRERSRKLPLDEAWSEFGPDLQKVVLPYPLGEFLPASHEKDGFRILRISAAGKIPGGADSLVKMLRPQLQQEIYLAWLKEASDKADIVVH